MSKIKQLDFAGQTIFCGMDVHKKNWRVNVRCDEFELEDYSQDPSEERLPGPVIPSQNYSGVRA